MEIIKRDGSKQEFKRGKIVSAIIGAMTDDIKNGVDFQLANQIALDIEEIAQEKSYTVEEIQDIIEELLMCYNRQNAARLFIRYRYEHEKNRERKSEVERKIMDVIKCTDVKNANANVDEYSFGGRKFESCAVVHKDIALNELMRPEVAAAHRQNKVYQHDLDSYSVGMHNCLFIDFQQLLKNGFETRNGDVRPPRSLSTAFQQMAVIFQCQSQVQFGGVASMHIDVDLAEFVDMSFTKYYKTGLQYISGKSEEEIKDLIGDNEIITITDNRYKVLDPKVWRYAYDMLEKEGRQSAQGFYHNLNTLESRAGSQLPFTSINFGRDTSAQGRLISKWLLEASLDGIGKLHKTSIFPISIFQYKKGVNAHPGDPNYDLKKLAIKSLCKQIYPNIVNGDFTNHQEDPNNPDTFMSTMGCRTMVGKDRFNNSYSKVGRGNVAPATINLPRLGLIYGIATGKRLKADLEGFWKELDELLELTEVSLVDRAYHIFSQNPKSAPFMYKNGTIINWDKVDNNVYEAMKHGSFAFGYIGVAEMCKALFGKDHSESKEAHKFALEVIKHMYDYTLKASERNNLNFSLYATPAENLCHTYAKALKREFGVIKDITDKEFITNSHHVPVWREIDIFSKIDIEAPFCYYATAGCITYVEFDSKIIHNPDAVESVIDYAMDKDIPYLAINFPIDTCLECGYSGEILEDCPCCKGNVIQHLARVTGYLSTDISNFNKGKLDEVRRRYDHSLMTWSDR